MSAICLIDTSVFIEILNVPRISNNHKLILEEMKKKIQNDKKLFLPMATILETGNHIAQNGSGEERRQCAEVFVKQVQEALDGKSPFNPIRFMTKEKMQKWIHNFPEFAMNGMGLGDLSIIQDWEMICEQNQGRKVYIWSLDHHLASYSKEPSITHKRARK